MGGSDDKQETTTEASPWAPAQGHITSGLDWANQIVQSQVNNVPQLGQLGSNSMLNNAWAGMSGSGMTDLAQQMGQAGADMMGQFDAGALKDIYGELAAGPSLYNQQSQAATLMAGKQAYLDEQNDASMAALNKAMAQSTGQIYGQAAGQGNVGSSRTQLATGTASSNLAAQQAATMANLYSQSYDTTMAQAMANEQSRLSGLGQQAQGMMGMANAGQSMLGAAGNVYQQHLNNQLTAGQGQMGLDQYNLMTQYQNAMNQWQAPQNLVGWYSGIAQGAGGLGGTTVSTGPANNGMMSGLMGMGSSFLGSSAGSSAVVGMFSDKRLKDNIRGTSYDIMLGLNIYEWDWNEKADELVKQGYGDKIGLNKGFIAQEVQEIYPEAVEEHESGYLFINMETLKESFQRIFNKYNGIPVFKDGKWLAPNALEGIKEEKEEV